MLEKTLANFRDDFFESHLGVQATADVLDGIIQDEVLPIKEADLIDWKLSPVK